MEWSITGELLSNFVVEATAEKEEFAAIGNLRPNGANTFQFIDTNLEHQYYRIKALYLDGEIEYSPIVSPNTVKSTIELFNHDGAITWNLPGYQNRDPELEILDLMARKIFIFGLDAEHGTISSPDL